MHWNLSGTISHNANKFKITAVFVNTFFWNQDCIMELPKCYKLLKENLLGIAHWIDWYTLFLNLNYQDMIFIVKLRRKLKPILSNLPSSSAVAGQLVEKVVHFSYWKLLLRETYMAVRKALQLMRQLQTTLQTFYCNRKFEKLNCGWTGSSCNLSVEMFPV